MQAEFSFKCYAKTTSNPCQRTQLDSWTAQVLPLVSCYKEDGQQTPSDPWLFTLRTLDLID